MPTRLLPCESSFAIMLVMILVSPFVIVTSTQADQAPEVATVALTEWTIPTPGSKPRGLTLDPSGNCCWFVESDGNRVVHLDPTTHTFKEWTIPTPSSNATDLAATAVSGSVVIFGTESAKNKVFIFFPETGTFREYTLPTANSGPRRISIEPDGPQIKAWFTELGVPSSKYKRNSIGQIIYNPESRAVKLYELTLPTTVGGGANDVHALAETVWFAGRTAIVRWDKTTSRFTTWAIPFHASTEASFIDVDDLGEVWYTSTNPRAWSTDNYVGVLRGDDTFTEWQLAKLGAGIEGLSISPLARSPWIAESGGDRIARLDPSAGGIVTTAYPTTSKREPVDGGVLTTVTGPVLPSTLVVTPVASTISSEIVGHFTEWMLPAGSDPAEVVVDGSGEVWMLETATNKVARLSLSPNFIVECDSSSLLVAQGTDVTDMCRVTSVDGFASTVELAGSWVGAEPTGVSFSLPSPVTPPPGGSVLSPLTISAGPTASTGTFAFKVTGASGPLIRDVHLTVTVAAGVGDFTITASPSYVSVVPGATATSTITIQSIGVFLSPVQLTTPNAPYGMTLRFEVNPVTPPVGGTATTLLTVVATGAQLGNHTITIVGNAGALNRSATFNARVSGGCLIATATYESELSDEVQFLREFRDNSILKTNAGSSFMTAFNSWYCSFSPTVAGFIREHSTARVTAKALLYPLVWILRFAAGAFALSPTNPEVGAVLSGLVASSLIGGVYFGPPLTILLACSRRLRRSARGLAGCSLAILIGAVAIVTLASTFGVPSLVMMIATCAIVLACVAVFALFTSMAAFYVGRRTCRGLGALFPVRSPTRG